VRVAQSLCVSRLHVSNDGKIHGSTRMDQTCILHSTCRSSAPYARSIRAPFSRLSVDRSLGQASLRGSARRGVERCLRFPLDCDETHNLSLEVGLVERVSWLWLRRAQNPSTTATTTLTHVLVPKSSMFSQCNSLRFFGRKASFDL